MLSRRLQCFCSRSKTATTIATQHTQIRLSSTYEGRQQDDSTKSASWMLLVPAAATFGCGVWQLIRMQEKQEIVDARQKALSKPAGLISSFSDLKAAFKNSEDDLVCFRLRGTWDFSNEILVGPRSRPQTLSARQNAYAPSGFHVITPLTLAGDQGVVLVIRGWIPRDVQSKPEAFAKEAGKGTEVNVLMRGDDKPHAVVPPNEPDTNTWFFIDSAAMSRHLSIPRAPVFELIREDSTPESELPIAKRVRDLVAFPVMPMGHASYAATWFTLSVCTIALSYAVRRKAAIQMARRAAAQAANNNNNTH
eukprot:c18590_g1_i1.p1 GENE.c18590_g1_i1~~c18590_g1_i1.p1  ORF type:complete len:318 (+),score=96.52 c18590_g1_i1:35-955(+)